MLLGAGSILGLGCDYAPICFLINNCPFCFVHVSEYALHFTIENGAMCMCYACMEREKRVLAVVYSEERVCVKVGEWKVLFVFLIHFMQFINKIKKHNHKLMDNKAKEGLPSCRC